MKESNQKNPHETKSDSLENVNGGYLKAIKKGSDSIGVYDNDTHELVTKSDFSGNLSEDREIFKGLTEYDITYHNTKKISNRR